MSIRPLTAADKPQIMAYLRQIPEFTADEVALAEELIDANLAHGTKSGYHFLVNDSGKITGYVCYGPTPITDATWDMYWIATDPAEQGKGIGRALTSAAEAEMKRQGSRMCLIETSSRPLYERIRRFYYHHGYEKICEVGDFYSVGDNRVILQKKFSKPE